MGSSPRVRGTLQRRRCQRTIPGIIPACAGNTGSSSEKHSYGWDHPRVCGEHFYSRFGMLAEWLSSPRVRGTLRPQGRDAAGPGIIPACAGNTRTYAPSKPLTRDHPRVCGEHQGWQKRGRHTMGSSPRVRGTQDRTGRHRHDPGIIPACAGNTVVFSNECRFSQDHPRVCGEHIHQWSCALCLTGSSPRVRGTRALSCARVPRPGIIPACAGNTRPCGPRCCSPRDHPRVCGEHEPVGMSYIECLGSSPRVRGTPAGRARPVNAPGIIPACAGNTEK